MTTDEHNGRCQIAGCSNESVENVTILAPDHSLPFAEYRLTGQEMQEMQVRVCQRHLDVISIKPKPGEFSIG